MVQVGDAEPTQVLIHWITAFAGMTMCLYIY